MSSIVVEVTLRLPHPQAQPGSAQVEIRPESGGRRGQALARIRLGVRRVQFNLGADVNAAGAQYFDSRLQV